MGSASGAGCFLGLPRDFLVLKVAVDSVSCIVERSGSTPSAKGQSFALERVAAGRSAGKQSSI